ncbi:hypothetical protein M1555_05320 [Patescibacteria group bacterium]|nr:hypothetical protein [Patescibacteria group bacterium]
MRYEAYELLYREAVQIYETLPRHPAIPPLLLKGRSVNGAPYRGLPFLRGIEDMVRTVDRPIAKTVFNSLGQVVFPDPDGGDVYVWMQRRFGMVFTDLNDACQIRQRPDGVSVVIYDEADPYNGWLTDQQKELLPEELLFLVHGILEVIDREASVVYERPVDDILPAWV